MTVTPLAVPAQAVQATATAVPPTDTPTPEPTAIPLEPIIAAPAVQFEGWSPDGEWLAYWVSGQADVSSEFYPAPPGTLNFRNVRTGQECAVPEIVSQQEEGDQLVWAPGGEVLVSTSGQSFQGTPCGGDFRPVQTPTETPALAAGVLSPGGEYRAETTVMDSSAGILSLSSAIIAVPDDQVILMVKWKIDERLGELEQGGEWLGGNQFLIYETLDRGPLLLTVSGEVIDVARELFGLEEIPSLLDPDGVSLRAVGAAGTDHYHIALSGVGTEANFPPVRLYHSESGQVEEMPFRYLWPPAFSPDGGWLLLDEHPVQEGYETYALWTRSVDPEGSPVHFLAGGSPYSLWSPDWSMVVFGGEGSFSVYAFPDGETLGSWVTGDYSARPIAWSPDGSAMIAHGVAPGDWDQALYLVQMK
jgi:hypothetical protein